MKKLDETTPIFSGRICDADGGAGCTESKGPLRCEMQSQRRTGSRVLQRARANHFFAASRRLRISARMSRN